jgi:hypothetical protein
MTDKWFNEISDSIISKKVGTDRKKRDPENKLQIQTSEIIADLEQRGLKLQTNFEHPQVDPELVRSNKIQEQLK